MSSADDILKEKSIPYDNCNPDHFGICIELYSEHDYVDIDDAGRVWYPYIAIQKSTKRCYKTNLQQTRDCECALVVERVQSKPNKTNQLNTFECKHIKYIPMRTAMKLSKVVKYVDDALEAHEPLYMNVFVDDGKSGDENDGLACVCAMFRNPNYRRVLQTE